MHNIQSIPPSNIIQQTSHRQSIPHLQVPSNASPPKPFLSPDSKKLREQKNLLNAKDIRSTTDLLKQKKLNHALFTIQENLYTRKNQHLLSPRPPKYKAPTIDLLQRNRQKKVIFTDNLTKQDKSTLSRKQSISSKSVKPIIKNMLTHKQDNLSNSSKSISVQNSFVSQFHSRTKKERPARIDNNKQKYAQILHHFQRNREIREERNKNKFARQTREKTIEKEEKYVDSIFPPVYTSIFQNSNKNSYFCSQIKWKRLSDLYTKQDVVILNKSGISQIKIVLPPYSYANQFIAIALNALKHSTCILQRIFQEQQFNQYGLYLVRIFQQSNWKSIILDQFIPVIVHNNDETATPAFITVEKEQKGQIQLWPYLLQKAFAYYYSAYQLLKYGNTIDFINQITGLCPLEINFKKKSQKEYTNLQSNLQSVDSFAIGQFTNTKKQCILRLRYSNESSDIGYSQLPNFTQSQLSQQIFTNLSKVYLYSPKNYHTVSTNTIGKYSLSRHHERAEYSIRKLVLTQSSDCIISLQQKQSRFFKKSSLDYHYMWVRVLLIQREFNGYRWIQGKYSNGKSITLNVSLTQGQYYLIIMPEWKQTQNFELTLLVWGNHLIGIQKQKGSCEQMIQQACMDLAQRKGRINQMASTLCSYNYVCGKTGMIIENINNQKLKQEIQVQRNISGIPCSVKLLPINKAFWPEKGKMITQIDITIPKLSSYTIVLKMKGGMDYKLIQFFSAQKQTK